MPRLSHFLGIPNIKQRLKAPLDELWDRRFGVHTFGFHPAKGAYGDPDWGSHFVPLGWRDIFAVLDAAELGPDDVFTDLGCGTGRAVFAAAHRGVQRAVGVEYVPWLAKVAEENRKRFPGKDIAIVEGDARDVSLADSTIVYMFHALGTGVLQDVLDRAERDRAAAGSGRLRICYVNPVFAEMLDRTAWLKPFTSLPGGAYPTRIWESR
ncbi:SAM-dependent methyltransferase [Sphingomonas vulcanisoli]|uniref:SAM-dependent methyltransferase n=1 Tax=Sphingomonas vulcanisoli TaxID=1658060 RepID=A0ABX0TQC4_9SPHN|nr:SAM-dependent methyltransferase [Sphingomonas vulcanisoli]